MSDSTKAAATPEAPATPDAAAAVKLFRGVRVTTGAKDGKAVTEALAARHVLGVALRGKTVRILTLDGSRHEAELA